MDFARHIVKKSAKLMKSNIIGRKFLKILPDGFKYKLFRFYLPLENTISPKDYLKKLDDLILIPDPLLKIFNYSKIFKKIKFGSSEKITCSIIICVHNKLNYTLNCLYSLSISKNKTPFEIIIVDDASSDKSNLILPMIKNLKYFKNASNKGFTLSANLGASKSKGEYLVFLNNDTLIDDFWLDNLIIAFKDKKLGLAGSKLIYPNGNIQEAGGIIFNDGSSRNYGRDQNPLDFRFSYTREVDYCSGASLAIKKNTFFKLGMFDKRYVPAYYEDTDLAMKVRKAGFKVKYIPSSQLFHYEGISHSKDISQKNNLYNLIEKNKLKFLKKWYIDLKKYKQLNDDDLWQYATRDKKILVLDHQIPTFDKDSGSFRMYQILKILSKRFHITFWPDNMHYDKKYFDILQTDGIECINAQNSISVDQFLEKNGKYYEHVIISRPYVVYNNLEKVKKYCYNAKLIYDTVDLHHIRLKRQADLHPKSNESKDILKNSKNVKNLEFKSVYSTDETWVVTEEEKKELAKNFKTKNIFVVPTIHPFVKSDNSFKKRKNFLFVGSFTHPPNEDAVLYLIKRIWPKIKKQIPESKLIIIGSSTPKKIFDLANEDILIKGFVEDLSTYLLSSRVFLAPLRYGAGMKGKIGQALAYGVPTVTTLIGREGFEKDSGLEIADTAEEFSKKAILLYDDEKIWSDRRSKAIKYMKKFSPDEIEKKLKILLP